MLPFPVIPARECRLPQERTPPVKRRRFRTKKTLIYTNVHPVHGMANDKKKKNRLSTRTGNDPFFQGNATFFSGWFCPKSRILVPPVDFLWFRGISPKNAGKVGKKARKPFANWRECATVKGVDRIARIVQLVRTLPSHGRGHWFESNCAYQSKHKPQRCGFLRIKKTMAKLFAMASLAKSGCFGDFPSKKWDLPLKK